MYVAGPWKDGDDTWQVDYTTAPFGICDRIFTKRAFDRIAWSSYLPQAYAALPNPYHMAQWYIDKMYLELCYYLIMCFYCFGRDPIKYGAESWEHVVISGLLYYLRCFLQQLTSFRVFIVLFVSLRLDAWSRWIHYASLAAFHSNKPASAGTTGSFTRSSETVLRLATQIYDDLMGLDWHNNTQDQSDGLPMSWIAKLARGQAAIGPIPACKYCVD